MWEGSLKYTKLFSLNRPTWLILNLWGKVMKRSGQRFENFSNKRCKITVQKSFVVVVADFPF